jgi:hypothetical protein
MRLISSYTKKNGHAFGTGKHPQEAAVLQGTVISSCSLIARNLMKQDTSGEFQHTMLKLRKIRHINH